MNLFINTPNFELAPIDEKKVKGIEITNAHGHDTIKNINDLIIEVLKSNIPIIGGIVPIKIANIITIGVYHVENLVINFSVLPFLEVELYTSSIILDAAEDSKSLITSHTKTPDKFILPDKISSFLFTYTGVDSPVKALLSIEEEPYIIFESNGTFSPDFIMIFSPILTFFAKTSLGLSFSSNILA